VITLTALTSIADNAKEAERMREAGRMVVNIEGQKYAANFISMNIDQMETWEARPGKGPLGCYVIVAGNTVYVREGLSEIDARYKSARSDRREP